MFPDCIASSLQAVDSAELLQWSCGTLPSSGITSYRYEVCSFAAVLASCKCCAANACLLSVLSLPLGTRIISANLQFGFFSSSCVDTRNCCVTEETPSRYFAGYAHSQHLSTVTFKILCLYACIHVGNFLFKFLF